MMFVFIRTRVIGSWCYRPPTNNMLTNHITCVGII